MSIQIREENKKRYEISEFNGIRMLFISFKTNSYFIH